MSACKELKIANNSWNIAGKSAQTECTLPTLHCRRPLLHVEPCGMSKLARSRQIWRHFLASFFGVIMDLGQ